MLRKTLIVIALGSVFTLSASAQAQGQINSISTTLGTNKPVGRAGENPGNVRRQG